MNYRKVMLSSLRRSCLPLQRGQGMALRRACLSRHTPSSLLLRPVTLVSARRAVHERPFLELKAEVGKGEAYDAARDALLQLNLMIRRGIEPDALMYTSLIATMARAGLEWQAYKLFSRMIESKIRPLPETYVALYEATNKHRRKLREQIALKIEEALSVLPEQLAEEELRRRADEDRRCIAQFEQYCAGKLPSSPIVPVSPSSETTTTATRSAEGKRADEEQNAPVATMHIRSPAEVLATAQHVDELHSATAATAAGPQSFAHEADAVAELQTSLHKLHEEELRIYLAANRQLRHGTKDELIARVLQTVPERSIRDMLARRTRYFRAVGQLLEHDMQQLRATTTTRSEEENENKAQDTTATTTTSNSVSAFHETDRTLTAKERDDAAPEVLYTPWGLLRKPARALSPTINSSSKSVNEARLERVRLSADELMLLRHKARSNELDELPESLLRRYAYQYQLRWRRRQPLSLLSAVQWHVLTFLPQLAKAATTTNTTPDSSISESDNNDVVAAQPTPALRLQQMEKEGMQRTLENYEAFRIIAQRTNNLQVVDNAEINVHLKRLHRTARQRERRTEDQLRRERNLLDAAELAASAKDFTAPPPTAEETSRVLGIDSAATSAFHALPSTSSSPNPALSTNDTIEEDEEEESVEQQRDEAAIHDELPPWALTSQEEEFNLTAGHFGSPEMGRFQELSDSHFRVLPSRSAQHKWSVDRPLLPGSLRDTVQEAELSLEQRREAVEREYARRLKYTRYCKWDRLLRRAQDKRAEAKAAEEEVDGDEGVWGNGEQQKKKQTPLRAPRRMSQLLRHGKDKQRVSPQDIARYTTGL